MPKWSGVSELIAALINRIELQRQRFLVTRFYPDFPLVADGFAVLVKRAELEISTFVVITLGTKILERLEFSFIP